MGNNQQNIFKDVFHGIAKYVCSCYSTQLMSIFLQKEPSMIKYLLFRSLYCSKASKYTLSLNTRKPMKSRTINPLNWLADYWAGKRLNPEKKSYHKS